MARHFRRAIFLSEERDIPKKTVQEYANVKLDRAIADRPVRHGDQFMAEFHGSRHHFLSVLRRPEAKIRDVMLPLELLEHVVGADAVAPVQGMEQATVHPENPQTLGRAKVTWRARARRRH